MPEGAWHHEPMGARFLTIADVAEQLSVSVSQVRALIRSGDLPAIQVGGRGQWRIETTVFEDYIARQYRAARAMLEARAEDTADH